MSRMPRLEACPKNVRFCHSRLFGSMTESEILRLAKRSNTKMMKEILAYLKNSHKHAFQECLEIARRKGMSCLYGNKNL